MNKALYWSLRLVPALILLQTLYFKFTGAEESVFIFSTLGVEPYGRIGSGIMELIAGLMLLVPAVSVYGAFLAAGIMAGAILSHMLVLGISVSNDGGYLFFLAIVILVFSVLVLFSEREKLLNNLSAIYGKIFGK